MGNILFLRGQIKQAFFYQDNVINSGISDQIAFVDALYNKGHYLIKIGFVVEAMKAYEKALLVKTLTYPISRTCF